MVVKINKKDLESLSVDELWSMHEKISRILSVKITTEKRQLEKRLEILNCGAIEDCIDCQTGNVELKVRRKYPKVVPRYRNPQRPFETWSGRGKRPRWLVAALESGRQVEEFMIRECGSSNFQERLSRIVSIGMPSVKHSEVID
jgi:DNA-binding protein H-NS